MRPLPPLPDWVTLEHQVAQILQTQEEHGWTFNERAAWELTSALQKEYEETVKILRDRHPQVQGSEFTPKRNNKTCGVRFKGIRTAAFGKVIWGQDLGLEISGVLHKLRSNILLCRAIMSFQVGPVPPQIVPTCSATSS